jgi:hypothetical protein
MIRAGKLIYAQDSLRILYDADVSALPILYDNACQLFKQPADVGDSARLVIQNIGRDTNTGATPTAAIDDGFAYIASAIESEDLSENTTTIPYGLSHWVGYTVRYAQTSEDPVAYGSTVRQSVIAIKVRVRSTFAKLETIAAKIDTVRVGYIVNADPVYPPSGSHLMFWGTLESAPEDTAALLAACTRAHQVETSRDTPGPGTYKSGYAEITSSGELEVLLDPDLNYDPTGKTGKALWLCAYLTFQTPYPLASMDEGETHRWGVLIGSVIPIT